MGHWHRHHLAHYPLTPWGNRGRTTGHLGTGDTTIIATRRKLLKVILALEERIEPQAARWGDLYNVRPVAIPLAKDVSFYEGAEE